MKAILLAGGKGTRLRPLTLHTPKPIVPVFGRAFLNYQIDLVRTVPEIDEVILSLNYQPRRIQDVFGDGRDAGIRMSYVVEPSPLGTGGAHQVRDGRLHGHGGGVQRRRDDADQPGRGAPPAPRAQGHGHDRAHAGRQPVGVRPGGNRRGRQRAAVPREAETRGHHLRHDLKRGRVRARARHLRPHPRGHGVVDRAQLLPVARGAPGDVCRVRVPRLLDRHRHAREVRAGAPGHHGPALPRGAVRRGGPGAHVPRRRRANRGRRGRRGAMLHRQRHGREGRRPHSSLQRHRHATASSRRTR